MKIKSNKKSRPSIHIKASISNKKIKSRNQNHYNFFPNRSVRKLKIRSLLIDSKETLDSPSNLQDTIKTFGDSSTFNTSKQFQISNPINTINKLKKHYYSKTSRKFHYYNIFDTDDNGITDNNTDKNISLVEKEKIYNNTQNYTAMNKQCKLCIFHHEEKICYFCIDCQRYFCNKCLLNYQYMNKHKSHRIVNYIRYVQLKLPKLKKELKNEYNDIEWYISRCNKYIENYETEKKLFLEQIDILKQNYINQINEYINKIRQMITLMNKHKKDILMKEEEIDKFLKFELFRDKINQIENITELKNKFAFNKSVPFTQKDINSIITSLKFRIEFKSFHTDLIKLSKKRLESNDETIYEFKLNLNKNYFDTNDESSFKIQHRRDWNPESVVVYFSLPKCEEKYYRNVKGFFLFRKYSGDTQIYSLNKKENNYFIFLSRDIPWKRFFSGDDFVFIKGMFFDFYFI